MKTQGILLDGYPKTEGKAQELLADRMDMIGSEIAAKDVIYKELSNQTVRIGKDLFSALDLPNEQARKLFDVYEMAVINQNAYILEKVYKQAFRDGIESFKALQTETAPI